MTNDEKLMQQVLGAVKGLIVVYKREDDNIGVCASCDAWSYEPHQADCKLNNAINALRERLAQPEQESVDVGQLEYFGNSVAYIHQKMTAYRNSIDAAWAALWSKGIHPDGNTSVADAIKEYVAPPQRTWAGSGDLEDSNAYLTTTQRKPLTDEQEPESFEQWNAKQHGDPEEIGFLQALRVAYCAGQDSMTAGMTRLAQPEQEPVAYATKEDFHRELERRLKHIREEMKIKSVTMRCKDFDIALPIIDTDFGRVLVGQVSIPPQRKPLTDEECDNLWAAQLVDITDRFSARDFIRDVEAAHGIKGES